MYYIIYILYTYIDIYIFHSLQVLSVVCVCVCVCILYIYIYIYIYIYTHTHRKRHGGRQGY